jgi:hypothetical protein
MFSDFINRQTCLFMDHFKRNAIGLKRFERANCNLTKIKS